MNWVDIIIALAIAVGFIQGWFSGFINQIVGFFGIFIAIWAGLNFHGLLEEILLSNGIGNESSISIIAVVVTFVLVFFGLKLVAKFIEKGMTFTGLGIFNSLGGALFGGLKHIIILSAISFYIVPILLKIKPEWFDGSQLLPTLKATAQFLQEIFF